MNCGLGLVSMYSCFRLNDDSYIDVPVSVQIYLRKIAELKNNEPYSIIDYEESGKTKVTPSATEEISGGATEISNSKKQRRKKHFKRSKQHTTSTSLNT